jgi:hypothetical protein
MRSRFGRFQRYAREIKDGITFITLLLVNIITDSISYRQQIDNFDAWRSRAFVDG